MTEREIFGKFDNLSEDELNTQILKEYSGKIYKIDPYFYEHYGKKYTS